jgi:hypothetical protein
MTDYFIPSDWTLMQFILVMNGNCPTFPFDSVKIFDELIILFGSYPYGWLVRYFAKSKNSRVTARSPKREFISGFYFILITYRYPEL